MDERTGDRNKFSKETSQAENNSGVSGAQRDRRFTRKRAISADADAAKEPAAKRAKRSKHSTRNNSAAESGSNVGPSDSLTKKSIDDLPAEVLEAVLQWISTLDVLKCRQVNRKFNESASRIMRHRADVQLYFSATDDGHFKRKIEYQDCHDQNLLVSSVCKSFRRFRKTKNLKELIECLKEAKNFPVISFRFDSLDKFGNAEVQSFLSIWRENIYALTISLRNATSNVGILRDLLTLPNLKKLEIKFNWREHGSNVELFVGSKEVTLPKLQVLCVNSNYRTYPGIIEAILEAAHSLKCFSISRNKVCRNMWFPDVINTFDFDMMQTLKKFHCLKELKILLSSELVGFLASKDIDLKLESLTFALVPKIRKDDELKSAAAILNRWFHSSKDTIQTLKIGPLASLGSDLHIPKFENLQKLHLYGPGNQSEIGVIFPPLFEMADQFPNLKKLSVTSSYGTSFVLSKTQQLKPMPSIEVLRIVGQLSSKCEETLLKATPNVTTLIIDENDRLNNRSVPINFKLISDCLPKLRSLCWLKTHYNLFLLHSMDAAITGLNEEFCQIIAQNFRNKDSLSAAELALYQLEPRNASILDLKELKRFEVILSLLRGVYAETNVDHAGFTPDDILYETGFSKVSKFLAFNLMPDVEVRTHKHIF